MGRSSSSCNELPLALSLGSSPASLAGMRRVCMDGVSTQRANSAAHGTLCPICSRTSSTAAQMPTMARAHARGGASSASPQRGTPAARPKIQKAPRPGPGLRPAQTGCFESTRRAGSLCHGPTGLMTSWFTSSPSTGGCGLLQERFSATVWFHLSAWPTSRPNTCTTTACTLPKSPLTTPP